MFPWSGHLAETETGFVSSCHLTGLWLLKNEVRKVYVTFRRYWVSKLPLVDPTLPPWPGPVMGSSGLWDLSGSFNIFSRWRLRLGLSLNSGSAWGLWITGCAWKSSTDCFLGARATHTSAPLSLMVGSYSMWVPPSCLCPAVAKIYRAGSKKVNAGDHSNDKIPCRQGRLKRNTICHV